MEPQLPIRPVAAAGEERLRVDEADGVPERVRCIEAALTPGSDLDRRDFSTAGIPHTRVGGLQIVDAEINVLRVRPGRLGIAIGKGVVAGEDRAPTREVVPPGGD